MPPSVVIADPQHVARLGARALLERADGLRVAGMAATGVETLRLVRGEKPDVLLMELHLEEPPGLEVIHRLVEAGSPVRVLVLSSHMEEALLRALLRGEVAGYLTKRSSPAQIVDAVCAVARGETKRTDPRVQARLARLKAQDTALDRLTPREWEIFRLLREGCSNREIADKLYRSEGTVKNHLTHLYEKLEVHTRAEALVWAHRHGLA